MADDEWDRWHQELPSGVPERERYTATILHTLSRLKRTEGLDWALTGGTALQAYLPPAKRRYSTDVEIITRLPPGEVQTVLKGEYEFETIHPRILKATLAPEGFLFVIHSYPPADYAAAHIKMRDFQHFPITASPPPGVIQIPMLDYDFLYATKIFALQEDARGGERRKDAYDLAVGQPLANARSVRQALDTYRKHRGSPKTAEEIMGAAGSWIGHFAGDGAASFEEWCSKFAVVPDRSAMEKDLRAAFGLLESLHGSAIRPSAELVLRFLLSEISLSKLGHIAKVLGYKGPFDKKYEKMKDYCAGKMASQGGKLPMTADELVANYDP